MRSFGRKKYEKNPKIRATNAQSYPVINRKIDPLHLLIEDVVFRFSLKKDFNWIDYFGSPSNTYVWSQANTFKTVFDNRHLTVQYCCLNEMLLTWNLNTTYKQDATLLLTCVNFVFVMQILEDRNAFETVVIVHRKTTYSNLQSHFQVVKWCFV